MKKNMGKADKVIRILVAIIVSVLYLTNAISGSIAIILMIAAGIFLATSLISICPLYTMLGINTCPLKKSSNELQN